MAKLAINGASAAADRLAVPEWPRLSETTREYVDDCLRSGNWCRNSGGGWCDRFEDEFAEYHDAKHAIAVANGTVAIELALRACGVQPGDEVIVPSYSFIASASAVPAVGAVPRFVDTDPETYNIDPDHLEAVITDDTVGIVGVHFAGYPMDLDRITAIADEHGLFIVEDSAHAQGSEWRGEKVGTFGDVGTFSFQESKSLSTGEGGMLVTDDDVIADRARVLHNIGRTQGATGYHHYYNGTNARLSEMQAALGVGQLESLDEENRIREDNEAALAAELESIDGITTKPRDDRITARGYCLENFRYDPEHFDGVSRDRFIEALNAEGVPCSDGYEMPLYRQPAFYREQVSRLVPPATDLPNYRTLSLPGAERVCRENVSFSHRVLLADREGVLSIADAVRKIQRHADEL